ncbi:hypothetical protein SPBR_02145 [Sporothrix brasiliensis 5110]|uniref:Uncharacterized protein n=1 Tax=Sporothrix brasiliensis 5110 TaxID=1398154 RepID=A0A0C2IWU9_9PEZI|nr:uncharacterized protein SPBR_02145 [Sporothrix brasiliensis 5110]KIH91225.1 hypothetical protein SPBR_02145 [Sporothrix brasiliensis 5110]
MVEAVARRNIHGERPRRKRRRVLRLEVPDVTGRVRRLREEDPRCGRQANFKPAQRPDRHVLWLWVLPSTGLAFSLAGQEQDTA